MDLLNICAHQRSYIYYAESIYSDVRYYAYKCESLNDLYNGKCEVEGTVVKMGGEPGNQRL